MKLPASWLREFVRLDASISPAEIGRRMAACGFAVEGLEGDVIDFEVTANRPDALSVYGLAREVSTAFDRELADAPGGATAAGSTEPTAVPVTIDSDACGRYALAIADVRVGPSPAAIADRLMACDVRPINNVVDVTNYVMLEMGQPMHAFDAAKLGGSEIHVRQARAGETLTTLDGESRTLQPSMLVIADRERAAAVAGVMGGRASEVSGGTKRIAIESAWFLPASVRATSKKLGLKTEASTRFERGADMDAPVRALERTLALLESIGAGTRAGAIHDTYPKPRTPRWVTLNAARLARLLGTGVPDADVIRILTKLGFTANTAAGGWQVQVPSFRVDVARETDLIEEVGRHWGFDRIPATFPALGSAPAAGSARVAAGRDVRRVLCGAGLQEAVTFTFIERAAGALVAGDAQPLVEISNPLSEKFAVLRPSMLPGLIDACVYNERRQQADIRLFEIGSTFSTQTETLEAGWLLAGRRHEHWSAQGREVDFYDAAGIAEVLAAAFDAKLRIEPADSLPWAVPGRSARLLIADEGGETELGQVGQVAPAIITARGGGADAVVAGFLRLGPLVSMRERRALTVSPLPRFPSVVRDLSILIDARLPAESVRSTIRAHASETLEDVREFDRYRGKGIPEGQVSLSMRLTFRSAERTLTDDDVDRAVAAVVKAIEKEHGGRLRA